MRVVVDAAEAASRRRGCRPGSSRARRAPGAPGSCGGPRRPRGDASHMRGEAGADVGRGGAARSCPAGARGPRGTVRRRRRREVRTAVAQVLRNVERGHLSERDDPLLVALAAHSQSLLLEVDVGRDRGRPPRRCAARTSRRARPVHGCEGRAGPLTRASRAAPRPPPAWGRREGAAADAARARLRERDRGRTRSGAATARPPAAARSSPERAAACGGRARPCIPRARVCRPGRARGPTPAARRRSDAGRPGRPSSSSRRGRERRGTGRSRSVP